MPAGFQGFGNVAGFVGSVAFSPSQIAALWWRADLGITQVAGPKVSAWLDQIEGLSLAQGTDALRPSYSASDAAYNNQAIVQTNATTFLASSARAIAQPLSIFLVGQCNTVGGTLLASSTSAATSPIIFATIFSIHAGTTLADGAVSFQVPLAGLGVYNGASSLAAGGDWLTGGTTGNAGATGTALFSVGAYSGGDFGGAGKIAEIIVLDHIASSNEKASLAAYFLTRYNLTVT